MGYTKRFGKYAFVKKGNMSNPKRYTNNKTLSSLEFYDKEFYQYAIIDPGPSSCAIRIERIYLSTGKRKLIWFSPIMFGKTSEDINRDMKKAFKYVKPFLIECHHIGVEHQLLKGGEVQYECYAVMMYYIGSSICTKGFRGNLFQIPVGLKTTYIGGPANKQQNGGISIKRWTQEHALEFCIEENDRVSYNILKSCYAKGFEDLSDTKCYCRGWVSYVYETAILTVPFNKKLLEKFI